MIDRHVTLAAAGLVIAGKRRDPLQQRRLPGAVLADDDGDGAFETQLEIIPQERKTTWIGLAIGDARRIEPKPPEIGCRQVDRSMTSRTHVRASRTKSATRTYQEHRRNQVATWPGHTTSRVSKRARRHPPMPSPAYALFRNAILAEQQVICLYKGRRRELCPHIIGTNKQREEVVLAWQFAGESSGPLPQWRCLRLANVRKACARNGPWYEGGSHRTEQSCVSDIDLDINVDVRKRAKPLRAPAPSSSARDCRRAPAVPRRCRRCSRPARCRGRLQARRSFRARWCRR